MKNEETFLTLRLRRQKTTYFISCGPFESIDNLKRKLLAFNKGVQFPDIRLYHGNKVRLFLVKLLDDKSNIHDQGIINNALIYFKLRKTSKRSIHLDTGEWEEIPEIGI